MIKVTNDKILIKEQAVEDKQTKGGIFIPSGFNEKHQQILYGEVITFGKFTNEDLVNGCTVIYNKFANSLPIEIEGEEYKIISESDVIAIEI